MALSNVVETIVKLRGSREFQQAAKQTAKSVTGIGDATEQSGKQAKIGWKGVAKWAGGTAAIYGAGRFLKGAVHETENLAKATLTLQRATGLDAKTASSWAEITKVRGIDTKAFQMSLTMLSKQMESARGGGKKATAMFEQLGVSQDAIAQGDVQSVLLQSADAFQRITNPAQKAALAQQLFGRRGRDLVPLLQNGSAGIQEQMKLVEKYGATIGNTEGAKEMIARQREMAYAMDGLKITLGTQLLPVIEDVIGAFLSIVRVMQPVIRNTTAMKVIIGTLTVAFVAYKLAVVAATLSSLGFTTTMVRTRIATLLTTAAMAGLNLSMLLIPLAIVAIGVGLYLLWKKCAWFRDAVKAAWGGVVAAFNWLKQAAVNTFNWIKTHWPLLVAILTGPIGLAVYAIVKNFDRIKKAISDVKNAVSGLPGKALGIVKSVVPGVQTGGTVLRGGAAVVGERGPELVHLPTRSTVFPANETASMLGTHPSLEPERMQPIYLTVDGKVLAQTMARTVSDKQARK